MAFILMLCSRLKDATALLWTMENCANASYSGKHAFFSMYALLTKVDKVTVIGY